MQVPIPRWLVRAWDRLGEWSNVPIYRRSSDNSVEGFEIRRIDLVLVFFGFVCVGYYWWTTGWQGAILGGAFYGLVVMMALWLF